MPAHQYQEIHGRMCPKYEVHMNAQMLIWDIGPTSNERKKKKKSKKKSYQICPRYPEHLHQLLKYLTHRNQIAFSILLLQDDSYQYIVADLLLYQIIFTVTKSIQYMSRQLNLKSSLLLMGIHYSIAIQRTHFTLSLYLDYGFREEYMKINELILTFNFRSKWLKLTEWHKSQEILSIIEKNRERSWKYPLHKKKSQIWNMARLMRGCKSSEYEFH